MDKLNVERQVQSSRLERRNVEEEEGGFWASVGRIFTFGCTSTADA